MVAIFGVTCITLLTVEEEEERGEWAGGGTGRVNRSLDSAVGGGGGGEGVGVGGDIGKMNWSLASAEGCG